jgi:hypothetical protein
MKRIMKVHQKGWRYQVQQTCFCELSEKHGLKCTKYTWAGDSYAFGAVAEHQQHGLETENVNLYCVGYLQKRVGGQYGRENASCYGRMFL